MIHIFIETVVESFYISSVFVKRITEKNENEASERWSETRRAQIQLYRRSLML